MSDISDLGDSALKSGELCCGGSEAAELPLAAPVGDLEVVVLHADGFAERFGFFETRGEAVEWAFEHSYPLGLGRCAFWHVGVRRDRRSGT